MPGARKMSLVDAGRKGGIEPKGRMPHLDNKAVLGLSGAVGSGVQQGPESGRNQTLDLRRANDRFALAYFSGSRILDRAKPSQRGSFI